ncbi:MAG TPA: hypothetical protein VFP72_08475 [Kineosporiaceae bacterium]|nr:hypothetical protein [Kineosporiaceae bacterium]
MTRTFRVTLAAVAAIGTGAVGSLVAAPAFAYPPEMAMKVAATPTGQPTRHGQEFTVVVTNAKPGCTVKISGGGEAVRATVGDNKSATAVLTVEADDHRRTVNITARTERCQGSRESASTLVTLSPGHIGGNEHGQHGKKGHRYDVNLEDWHPHRRISVIATNGRDRFDLSDRTDDHGRVSVHFTPNRSGTWAVVVVQDGQTSNMTIEVD